MVTIPQTVETEQVSRVGYKSRAILTAAPKAAGEVNPDLLRLTGVVGLKAAPGAGIWLDCLFSYAGPRGAYALQAPVLFGFDCQPAGRAYFRSCTCPDWAKRAEAGKLGEARLCKHLIALRAKLAANAAATVAPRGVLPVPVGGVGGFTAPVDPVAGKLLAQYEADQQSVSQAAYAIWSPGCAQVAGGEGLEAA
jgi:hypothetical protein